MTIAEFLSVIEDKRPPAPADVLESFEAALGRKLPADYRRFLIACNGGNVQRDYWFLGPTPEGRKADAGIDSIGGFRRKNCPTLPQMREDYRGRIPNSLFWIMDDPFGNAICLGWDGVHSGKVYFWDHENEPDDDWNGDFETAGNIQLLANSFTDFVAGLQRTEDE